MQNIDLETLIIEYDTVIAEPYYIDRKKNKIHVNPIYNNMMSISFALFEYLGCRNFDKFYEKHRVLIYDFADKLQKVN